LGPSQHGPLRGFVYWHRATLPAEEAEDLHVLLQRLEVSLHPRDGSIFEPDTGVMLDINPYESRLKRLYTRDDRWAKVH
jgi:hypothetical protein